MLYNICYITYPELLYNIQIWLYNIQDGYITHPNLPDVVTENRGMPVTSNPSKKPIENVAYIEYRLGK